MRPGVQVSAVAPGVQVVECVLVYRLCSVTWHTGCVVSPGVQVVQCHPACRWCGGT